jgi:hypothetical protein
LEKVACGAFFEPVASLPPAKSVVFAGCVVPVAHVAKSRRTRQRHILACILNSGLARLPIVKCITRDGEPDHGISKSAGTAYLNLRESLIGLSVPS